MAAKPCVFIHTNDKQMIGALVGQHALRRNSGNAEKFDVRIIRAEEFAFLREREGQRYLHNNGHRVWRMDDLQSFTPLRFMPPELMGYEGRAIVIDPDVFAVGDVWELLSRDMGDHAILARDFASTGKTGKEGRYASSVMLLDCAKLAHWKPAEQFAALFEGTLDYHQWIFLMLEPPGSIGLLEPEWNDLDRLGPGTKMLHNTARETQPWKTGLPVDFVRGVRKPVKLTRPGSWLRYVKRDLLGRSGGRSGPKGHYVPHPDSRQEAFFFGLLRECLDEGIVTEAMLQHEMRRNHVRHDALEVLDRMAG